MLKCLRQRISQGTFWFFEHRITTENGISQVLFCIIIEMDYCKLVMYCGALCFFFFLFFFFRGWKVKHSVLDLYVKQVREINVFMAREQGSMQCRHGFHFFLIFLRVRERLLVWGILIKKFYLKEKYYEAFYFFPLIFNFLFLYIIRFFILTFSNYYIWNFFKY